jgi:EpsI family protein
MLLLGAAGTLLLDGQRGRPLRAALDAVIALELVGFAGRDVPLSAAEREVAGMTAYVLRSYQVPASDTLAFGLFVAYYDRQTGGRSIHSPKNCLPGGGWQALTNRMVTIEGPGGPVQVNGSVVQNGARQALVLYWYQGRGRIEANEYAVKWQLLRDAMLRRRSDEALVRVVVPVAGSEARALELASRVARAIAPAVGTALPAA